MGRLRLQGQLEDQNLVFTLNPEAARRRLEGFLVPMPGRCALFVMAAAVASRASLLTVEPEREAITFSFDGAPAGPTDLENLLSSLFVAHSRKELQELALGLFSGVQEGARRACVTAGRWRFELGPDGQDFGTTEEVPGWKIRLDGIDPSACVRSLRERCRAAPIQVVVDKTLINPGLAFDSCLVVSRSRFLPLPCSYDAHRELVHKEYEALVVLEPGRRGRVQGVLGGVGYELPAAYGDLPFEAFVWDPPLSLDLSREAVVEEGALAELLGWVARRLEVMTDALLESYPELGASERVPALEVLNRMAAWRRHRGDYRGAAAVYRKLLETGSSQVGPSLGGLCLMAGEFLEAERLLEGSGGPLAALARAARGEVSAAQARLQALERRQKKEFDAVGEGWRLVDTLLVRTRVALLEGRVAEAERYCKRAMARALGAGRPRSLPVLLALGEVYLAQGRSREALTLAVEARDECRRLFGSESQEEATALCFLAAAALSAGRNREARESSERAEGILRALFGDRHPEVSGSLVLQGLSRAAEGELEQAVRLVERGAGLRLEALGPEHRETWVPVLEAAGLHQRAGCPGRCLESLEPLLEHVEGRSRARALNLAARARMAGEPARALTDLEEAWGLALSEAPSQSWSVAFNWWHWDDPVSYRLPVCAWEPLGREHLMVADIAAHRARLHRLRQEPALAAEWAARARCYRKTTGSVRLSERGRFKGLNTRRLVELDLEVHAPGRILEGVSLQSALGGEASSHGRQGVLLLVLSEGQPINRPGDSFEHPLGDAPERLALVIHEPPPFQVGAMPFVVDLHFVEGPRFRLPVRV